MSDINSNNQSISHNINYNDEYMQGIGPYLESLSFFSKVPEISDEFGSKYSQNNKNPNLPEKCDSINDFITEFIENSILKNGNEDNNMEFKEKKEISFEENPDKIFTFLLDELHKIFKNDFNEEDKINAIEYDENKAKITFEEFIKNNNSIISDLFYGTKFIQKYCLNCRLTQYIYKYLKCITLDLKNIKDDVNVDLQYFIKNIQNVKTKTEFCPMCSSDQKKEIKISITKKPKILIIIIINPQNNIRINYPQQFDNNKYRLIAVEKNNINDFRGIKGVFQYIKNCFSDIFQKYRNKPNQKYEFIFFKNKKENKENNNETVYKLSKPYVLFYKRKEGKNSGKQLSEEIDLSEHKMISDEKDKKTDIENELKNSIVKNNISYENGEKYQINIRKNKFKNNNNNINNITNNIISNENTTNNNINNNNYYDDNSSMGNQITLYFFFIDNNKELYIDVKDNEKFENILGKLINHYKLVNNPIKNNNFTFDNKKIDLQKSPKQLRIKSESRIFIKSKNPIQQNHY